MLEVRNVSKKYGSKIALNNCSFKIKKGEICGLFGLNGAGKSSLIKIISGIEKSNGGELFFDGVPFDNGVYPKVGAMIEKPAFFPNMTGYQNLKLLADLSGECNKESIISALEKVNLLDVKNDLVKSYSLGMQQRLYFASAVMRNVDIMLFDEPFNGIDPIGLFQLGKLIVQYAREGKTILISSHNIKEIQEMISHAIFIDNGEIIYDDDKLESKDIYKLFVDRVTNH